MSFALGTLFAFGALLAWGSGDFLIQRTTRHIGDWETLFLISIGGTILLTPFALEGLGNYLAVPQVLGTMVAVSLITFAAAIIDFEALKRGKIAAVEPILSLEIPTVAVFSLVAINETLTPIELILIVLLMVGLALVSLKSHHLSRKAWIERGVILAVMAAILLGFADFLVGFGARITNPIVINWFINLSLTLCTFIFIAARGGMRKLAKDVMRMPGLVAAVCTLDNFAWVSYAFATVLMPITVAVAISENFIVLAAVLGILVNKEMFGLHQKVELVMALASAAALALMV